MDLDYAKVKIHLQFEHYPSWSILPTVPLRSILGARLRSVSCSRPGILCADCLLAEHCAYGCLFESRPAGSGSLEDTGIGLPRPFVLTFLGAPDEGRRLVLGLTLVGRAVGFLPHIHLALAEAGELGIFRSRLRYRIESVHDGVMELLDPDGRLRRPATYRFQSGNPQTPGPASLGVECLSPLRIKHHGHYTHDFDAYSLFMALHRRITMLAGLYGEARPQRSSIAMSRDGSGQQSDGSEYGPSQQLRITERRLSWHELPRYSHRQESSMSLGGVIGHFRIEGPMSDFEYSLLQAGLIFHAGKNAGFGLGHIALH